MWQVASVLDTADLNQDQILQNFQFTYFFSIIAVETYYL